MRTNVFLASVLAASAATGCKWTDFEDLQDQTWVHATKDPELGANDYAVAIAGVETGAAGGSLVVISDDSPNYSTLEYSVDGSTAVGTNPAPFKLSTQNIGSIADAPVFAVDEAGAHIGLVERAVSGSNYALLVGTPTAPASVPVMTNDPTLQPPDAATFVGSALVFTAASSIFRIPMSGMQSRCLLVDDTNMPVSAAGIGVHGTELVVWTKTNKVLRYATADVETCQPAMGATVPVAPQPGLIAMDATLFTPGPGARVHVVGNLAVLSAKAANSRIGEIHVINLTTFTEVGDEIAIDGLRSSIVADLGGVTYIVAGIPDRAVKGVVTGAVELYELTTTTGEHADTPVLTLYDHDPESGQQFGRTVAAMSFRGDTILVVGAAAEVFAYFRTAVYDHLP